MIFFVSMVKTNVLIFFNISPALVYLIVGNMVKTANTIKGKIKFEYVDEKMS